MAMTLHDFSVGMLARLVVDGLIIARHEGGGRTVDIVRVKITDAGRAALRGFPLVAPSRISAAEVQN